jgi:uncharacterized protein YndB with AHSA1/START domain
MAGIYLTRFLPARRTDVWHAFTDVDRFTEWFWPPRLAPVVVLDVRPGGEWRVSSSIAGMTASGTYGELDEPILMTFSWQWEGDPELTAVTLRFDDDGDRATMLRIEHTGFADDARAGDHERGWSDCLDRLPSILDR